MIDCIFRVDRESSKLLHSQIVATPFNKHGDIPEIFSASNWTWTRQAGAAGCLRVSENWGLGPLMPAGSPELRWGDGVEGLGVLVEHCPSHLLSPVFSGRKGEMIGT